MHEQPGPQAKPHFISTTSGMSGHFAVEYWWNPGEAPHWRGFWEPYETGIGRYHRAEDAVAEAKHWAESVGLEYRE